MRSSLLRRTAAPTGDVVLRLSPKKRELMGLLEDPTGFAMALGEALGVEADVEPNEFMQDRPVQAFYVTPELAEEEGGYPGVHIMVNEDLLGAWSQMDPEAQGEFWEKFLSVMDEAVSHENVHKRQDQMGELKGWEKSEVDRENLITPQEMEAHSQDAVVELQNQGLDDMAILRAINDDDMQVLGESETISMYREELGDESPEWFAFLKMLTKAVQ